MRILLGFLTLLLLSFSPAVAERRVALIIGNSDYQVVNKLTNPANDARLMEETLKTAGFEVTRLENLDQRAMKQALVNFGRQLKKGADASMFYYAGHGVEVDGQNYLVPIDANAESKDEVDIQAVRLNDFMSLMQNSGVPLNIIVLDACRNNPFRSMRSTGGGLAPVNAPTGSYVAYSTAPGSVAADGTEGNSPFTLALAESIRQPGLTLEAVFKRTRTNVRKQSNGEQVPFDSSSIEGEFYFKPSDGRTSPEENAAPQPQNEEKPQALVLDQTSPERVIKDAPAAVPRTIRVAADGSGEFTSLVDAVATAAPTSRIEVMPGIYDGALKIDKNLDIVGMGAPEQIIIQATSTFTIRWLAAGGSLERVTVKHYGGCLEVACSALFVDNASPKISLSRFSSENSAAVTIGGELANPFFFANAIGPSKLEAIIIYEKASGTLEGNEISQSSLTGVVIMTLAKPLIRLNKIHDNGRSGLVYYSGSVGKLENNEIYQNSACNVIFNEATGTLTTNIIRDGRECGIYVEQQSSVSARNNEVTGHATSGIIVKDSIGSKFENNKITQNGEYAVVVYADVSASLVANNLSGNTLGPWFIDKKAGKIFRKDNNYE
jgi:parallel beta-helix repeat protein